MVARALDGARLILTSPLLGHLTARSAVGRASGSAIRDFSTRIGLGLGSVVNYNDLLGEAIFVKVVPIRLTRAATLPGRLLRASGRSGLRHDRGRIVRVVTRRRLMGCGNSTRNRGVSEAQSIRSG